jgi:cyclopropane fatty-acyl-phospholipid synthase-like methyltransferase
MASILTLGPLAATWMSSKFKFYIQPLNFIAMYGMIGLSQAVSSDYWPLVYTTIFLVYEALHSTGRLHILSDEERVDCSYQWFDEYLPKKGDWLKNADLTEGYFKGDDWSVTSEVSLKQKYERIYELMSLEPGMKVLDLGCGYGQWMAFLKSRGVESVGATLSQNHRDHCSKQGLEVRIADARKIPSDLYGKFDAVSLLGSVEHMAKVSWSPEQADEAYASIFEQARLAMKPDTKCGKVMITVINSHEKWTLSTKSFTELAYGYLIDRHYSGRYPVLDQMLAVSGPSFKRVHDSDQTEDYRYISIMNPNHFGNFSVSFDTLRKVVYAPFMFLTDPYAIHKWLYHLTGAWMWQFGGRSPVPSRERKTPFCLKWEVYERIK